MINANPSKLIMLRRNTCFGIDINPDAKSLSFVTDDVKRVRVDVDGRSILPADYICDLEDIFKKHKGIDDHLCFQCTDKAIRIDLGEAHSWRKRRITATIYAGDKDLQLTLIEQMTY